MNADLSEVIEAAWHGQTPVGDLSREFLVSESTIRRCWRHAQKMGRLPAGPRPFFLKYASVEYFVAGCVLSYAIDSDNEIAFALDRDVRSIGLRDPLLAALERVHGADPRRYENDDARLCDRRTAPQPAAVLAECRMRDAEAML